MLAIIGGTGLYQLDGVSVVKKHTVLTPYGSPSAAIVQAQVGGKDILFLPRHGESHEFLPHEINYRANIYALKKLGARQVISVSAMGSLREDLQPGQFVIPGQYIDYVKMDRPRTFFGEGLAAHVSMAQPTCTDITQWITEHAREHKLMIHTNKTYVCVDGPRLGTRAESHFLRLMGGDVVGMTNVPEVFLAKEAQLCYATLGIVTDYDCWMEDPAHHVTVAQVIERYGESLQAAGALLVTLMKSPLPKINPAYRESLAAAILTREEAIPLEKRSLLEVLTA